MFMPSLLDQEYKRSIDPTVAREVPVEVTSSPLAKFTDEALEGRLRHYEREAIFERSAKTREVWKREVERTQAEINRRKFIARQQAEAVFKAVAE